MFCDDFVFGARLVDYSRTRVEHIAWRRSARREPPGLGAYVFYASRTPVCSKRSKNVFSSYTDGSGFLPCRFGQFLD
ncbi:hypothetical protein L596_000153 [Steinernema carpocapsae]|uniref:Uncharacterized protein n=1 Tax=Steinernema carpocapsae TaxID=34508 RepID=A0A4U8UH72_STECR|nr:hypothetical protein L596_000153 [Steinernema carpocapsae]